MKNDQLLGIVLCAGLGTRLRPLTQILPKPAVPVGPVPAALRNIEQLLNAGCQAVHCNTHYLTETLIQELQGACDARGIARERVRFWNEDELLETGGGIARIVRGVAAESGRTTLSDTLVVSGDVVADIPLQTMTSAWAKRTPEQTTLMVTLPLDKPRKDVTWVDLNVQRVVGFGADLSPDEAAGRGAVGRVFSNHQIISSKVLERASIEKRSSIDLFYRDALKRGEHIIHVPYNENGAWFDIGTPETYLLCLSALNHSLPDQLRQLCLGKIDLCLPDQPLRTSGSSSTRHAQESSTWFKFAQECLSKTDQATPWIWLGHLHILPPVLHTGLTRIVETCDKPPELGAQGASSHLFPAGFSHSSRGGAFLLNSQPTLPVLPGSPSLPCEAFMDAPLPAVFHSLSTPPTPLLIPFDLLLGVGSGASIEVPVSRSPFWILFTRPQQ